MPELRGRLRPGDKLTVVEPLSTALRGEHALPLGGERTTLEQLIEAEEVVGSLATQLELNFDVSELSGRWGGRGTSASTKLVELAKDLSRARLRADGPGVEEKRQLAWQTLAAFLYDWDARMQDVLAGGAFSEASAYQLGRGMGEIAWLDPSKAGKEEVTSWRFLLGERRVKTLRRLVTRLAAHFQPLTAAGVSASLETWQKAAVSRDLGQERSLQSQLREQTRRWRDLLLTDLDPMVLVPPANFLSRARQLRHVLRAYWPELILASVGALAAAAGAALLAGAKHHDSLAAFLAVLGGFGITTSALIAKAKSEAQALIGQLRAALDEDLVVQAIVVAPPSPSGGFTRRGREDPGRATQGGSQW